MKNIKLAVVILVLFAVGTSCKNNATTQPVSATQDSPVEKSTNDVPDNPYDAKETPLDPSQIVPPLQAIKNLDKEVENYHTGQNLTPEQVEQNKSVKQKIIRGTFDIRELCRLSLGRHWETLKDDERRDFVGMMTQLLETKALFSKEQVKGNQKLYHIDYKSETFDKKDPKIATVLTKMVIAKENISPEISYKLLLTPYGWKIFDVIVDESSLLLNYKVTFDNIITKNGYPELVKLMKKKLDEISGKAVAPAS